MNIPVKPFDIYSVKNATYRAQSYVERCTAVVNDTNKEKRLKEQECKVCYTSSKIGGAALCSSQCGICQKTLHYSNTCIDILCKDCAKEHNLCKHCGGDIELKNRNIL